MASVINISSPNRSRSTPPNEEELLKLKQELELNTTMAKKKTREANTLKKALTDAYDNEKAKRERLQTENTHLRRKIAALKSDLQDAQDEVERLKTKNRKKRRSDDEYDFDDHVGSTTELEVGCDYNMGDY